MARKRSLIALIPLLLASSCLGQATEPSAIPFGQTAVYKAYDLKTLEPAVSAEDWTKYEQTLGGRADEVLKDLALADASKSEHVKTSVIDYYKFLRAWHDQHDTKMQQLSKNAAANAPQISDERKDLTTCRIRPLSLTSPRSSRPSRSNS